MAQSLIRLGHDVMGIDKDADLVQRWSNALTCAVQADSTDVNVMRQLRRPSMPPRQGSRSRLRRRRP
ncbi:NAD-binding protein [Cupriavidus sp. NPDC089707]|uniref:NAD-binding protein n=1 Tax=Cupriavidus sp. NPDC089707 TaxID=3363963 RepID=UPI003808BBC6